MTNRYSTLACVLGALLFVAVSLPSGTARAGTEEARQLFERAKQKYGNKEYEEAAKLLQQAYQEEANLIYQYNRIRALQGAGQYRKALEVLKTYKKPMLDADDFKDIPDIETKLEAKIEQDSPSGDDDVQDDFQKTTESKGRVPWKPIGWALLGTGGASMLVGGYFGLAPLSANDIWTRHQNTRSLTGPQQQKLKRHKALTAVFLGVGAAAAIGGGTMLYVNSQKGGRGGSRETERARIRLLPVVGRGRGGALLDVQF